MDPDLRVRRLPEKQLTDLAALHAVLDDALIAHVAVVRSGAPVALPFACARDESSVLLHGSTGAGVLRIASGDQVCVTVTHLDGLVFARSLFESSMHYRCAVILGAAEVLQGESKVAALEVLSGHLMPGRPSEVRANALKELAATLVLRVPLDRFSLKVSDGPAEDPDDGESRRVWAGILPLALTAGRPVTSPDVPADVGVPESVRRAADRARPPS
jgi:nitroimidazol reductase NimA-like FMN-containing flavoprotein (pyridoxamine 5'-phosphate oxidase superfamily)